MLEPGHDQTVVLAYRVALSRLVRVFSGLAVAGVIVYGLGWLRLSGYYLSFGTSWILSGVTSSELIFHGVWPLFVLLGGLLFSFMDIAKRSIGRDFYMGILYTLIAAVIGILLSLLLRKLGYFQIAVGGINMALIATAMVSMGKIGEVVLEVDRNGALLHSKQILSLINSLFFFGLITMNLGLAEGERDKRNTTSTLPLVTAEVSPDQWRLLIIRGDLSYLAKLATDQVFIKIIKTEDISMIVPYKENAYEKPEKQEDFTGPQP